MFGDINLRDLAEEKSNDRSFLSIYLSSPESIKYVDKRLENLEKLSLNSDEKLHLKENIKRFRDYLKTHNYKKGSLAVFINWLSDFLKVYELETDKIEDTVQLSSTPYIRPIAYLQDEYEDFAFAAADNKKAEIYLVSSLKTEKIDRVKGNIKNHVKVGGWSQQRYERRRDKELKHYAKDIVNHLIILDDNNEFSRLFLVGSEETVKEIEENLPNRLKEKLAGIQNIDLKEGFDKAENSVFELFIQEERREEADLWSMIKNRYYSNSLACIGLEDTIKALKNGRAEKIIVLKNFDSKIYKCRNCGNIETDKLDKCSACGSESLFEAEVLNIITELSELTGSSVDFAENIEELKECGSIGALLRF